MTEGTDAELPACPGCGGQNYSIEAQFGNLSCDDCGYMPRRAIRNKIQEALNDE